MSRVVKKKVRVLSAQYIKEAQSIVIVGECENGRLRHQIHRDCFSYGDRTEKQIEKELENTAKMMVGKEIWMVFDPDLNGKIKDHVQLKY
jgi:hypothetical protein